MSAEQAFSLPKNIRSTFTDQNGYTFGPGVCGNGYVISNEVGNSTEPVCCRCRWRVVQNTPVFEQATRTLQVTIQAGVAPTACIPQSLGRTCYGEES